MFKTMSTADLRESGPSKVLLYTHHGWGKTYSCRHYQRAFGKGLILSGESGLKSVEDVAIDYLPFASWDGPHDPERGLYSFRGAVAMLRTPEFRSAGYQWIAIDSLTELSDRLLEHLEREHAGSNNGFAMWGDYSRLMIGALKWVRDLPLHVFVTCLAKEEQDANGTTHYWPMLKGQAVAKQVPALFDHVFGGIRISTRDKDGNVIVRRALVTDEVDGWHGKVRDPQNTLRPIENEGDLTKLLERMRSTRPEGAETPGWAELAG